MVGNSSLHFRKAHLAEANELVHLYHDAYTENMQMGFPASAASVQVEEIAEWIENAHVYVAELEGEIVGAVRLMQNPEWGTIVLSRLGVPTRWKGHGIATQLMTYAEQQAVMLGFATIRLTTASNHPYLPDMYGSKGYHKVGFREVPDRPYDEVIMEKILVKL